MTDAADITPFPFLNTPLFWWISSGLFALFVCAVILVFIRRGLERRQRLALEWEQLKQLADDKNLNGPERNRLFELIQRRARKDPMRAATSRFRFNECVEAEMASLRDSTAHDTYAQAGAELRRARIALGLDYLAIGQRITGTRDLQSGQTLWLAAPDGMQLRWRPALVSLVDESWIVIVPSHDVGGPLDVLQEGASCHCRMWRQDDGRYYFSLILHRREANPTRWIFCHTTDLQRTQDRAHFRVNVDYTTDVEVLEASGDTDADVENRPALKTTTGRIINISAGGLAVVVQSPLPKRILLRLVLALPEAGRLTVVVKPVEVVAQPDELLLIRGFFVRLDDDTRDAIARFVIHRQQFQLADSHGSKVTIP